MPIALAAAGVLGIVYVVLSLRVSLARRHSRVSLGDGAAPVALGREDGATKLQIAVRAHGNFAEYVPLGLLLLGGIEAAGAGRGLCVVLAVMLVAGRLMHPLGMARKAPNLFRLGGTLLTWLMIVIAAVAALILALR
jgi:uncharacterized membrane protein YecN with MAPEG domain